MVQCGQLYVFFGYFVDCMFDVVVDVLIWLCEFMVYFSIGFMLFLFFGMFGLLLVDEYEVDCDLLLIEMVWWEMLCLINMLNLLG